MINQPVVMECEGFPKNVVMKYYEAPMSDIASHFSTKFKEHLLEQVNAQTGLTWAEEMRNVRRLSVGVEK
jgi:fatty acid/phospholipid biosynthesis enzyme